MPWAASRRADGPCYRAMSAARPSVRVYNPTCNGQRHHSHSRLTIAVVLTRHRPVPGPSWSPQRWSLGSVTIKVTTPPNHSRRCRTQPDKPIALTCPNTTHHDPPRRSRQAWHARGQGFESPKLHVFSCMCSTIKCQSLALGERTDILSAGALGTARMRGMQEASLLNVSRAVVRDDGCCGLNAATGAHGR
jgi:hypothetical protein